MPITKSLEKAVAKLQLRTLGELNGVSADDFARTGSDGLKHVRKLGQLIKLAQQVGERISVPPAAKALILSGFHLPVRLAHVLAANGFHVVGDLDGVPLLDFYGYRNCGKETVQDLEAFLSSLQQGKAPKRPAQPVVSEAAVAAASTLSVAPHARDLIPSDLPISVRLEGVLGAMGAKRLGDVNGRSLNEVLRMKNCGRKTLAELKRLIERAAAGEFAASPLDLAKLTWADLPPQLDELIAQLPKRTRQIVELRFARPKGKAPTLEEVGTKFKVTRERVRQVLVLVAEALPRMGGLRLKSQIRRIATICEEAVCPLTPELLAQWVAVKHWPFAQQPVFYVRLLGLICPELPAWPDDQEPFLKPAVRAEKMARVVESLLQTGIPSLPLRSAFERVRAQQKNQKLNPSEFLLELKHSWSLAVRFPKPDRPEVLLSGRG